MQKRNFIEHKYFIRRHKTYEKARNQIQRLLLHKSALSFFISKNVELLIYVRCINENGWSSQYQLGIVLKVTVNRIHKLLVGDLWGYCLNEVGSCTIICMIYGLVVLTKLLVLLTMALTLVVTWSRLAWMGGWTGIYMSTWLNSDWSAWYLTGRSVGLVAANA